VKSYKVEAWSLTSPAAPHESRSLTASGTVSAESPEAAAEVFAKGREIPRDYWHGTRASAVSLKLATRYRRGTKGERVPETVIVGHAPYVVLRVEEQRVKQAKPFNSPHLRMQESKARHEDAMLERHRGLS
jgi:hypothetical protein